MEKFLKEGKKSLECHEGTFVVVMGNESCDLDSVISSIVFAMFLSKINKSTDIIVPVMNVIREDLFLKTEVIHFLKKSDISYEDLICIDEINLQALKDKNRLKLIIVDHNALSDEQASLHGAIIKIIDHHKVNNTESIKSIESNIESVGSCCTLVAEEILSSPDQMDYQMAYLLLGTILLDTVCLRDEAKRVTEKDKIIAEKLRSYLKFEILEEDLFNELVKAKSDVSRLTPEQLLRRDTKYISIEATNVAVASLPMLLEDIIEQDQVISALEKVSHRKNLSFVVIMGCQITSEENRVKRQIAIYDGRKRYLDKVSSFLIKLENPSLNLRQITTNCDNIRLFDQENVGLSRKFVLPAIEEYLKSASCDT